MGWGSPCSPAPPQARSSARIPMAGDKLEVLPWALHPELVSELEQQVPGCSPTGHLANSPCRIEGTIQVQQRGAAAPCSRVRESLSSGQQAQPAQTAGPLPSWGDTRWGLGVPAHLTHGGSAEVTASWHRTGLKPIWHSLTDLKSITPVISLKEALREPVPQGSNNSFTH